MDSDSKQTKLLIVEIISLSTARGRLILFGVISFLVLLSRYEWLNNLSLYKFVGWESAPSVGLTRAYWLVLHGQPLAAWERNWLIYPVLAIVLYLVAADAKRLFIQRR